MTWNKKDLENMLNQLKELVHLDLTFDLAYGGYRIASNKGSHIITKNKRYTKQEIGRFLSDTLELIEWSKRS